MTTAQIIGLLILGFAAGYMSSLIGIGGGIIIVPTLVFMFGMTQKMAQGTSLAMLTLPVAFIGAYNYYKGGHTNWQAALMLAVTFVIGGYLGSKTVLSMDMTIIKKIFAIFMIIIAIKYLFFDK
ncbi:MAG: sulfite exporter TauE/SafE family protein [Sphingobacteriales bacterium]|nr:MAG: sulfite exporter TauE/SafE family protein [Sphingobacteriales bacterium]